MKHARWRGTIASGLALTCAAVLVSAQQRPQAPSLLQAYKPVTADRLKKPNENLSGTSVGERVSYSPGSRFTGATTTFYIAPGADHIGDQAWNVDTGKRVWTHTYATSPTWGPMLATGGGGVFSGGTNDRNFHAFDAANGQLLWEFPTHSGIIGQPSSFMGWAAVHRGAVRLGIDSRGMQTRLNEASPGNFPEVPEGGAIWAFAVK